MGFFVFSVLVILLVSAIVAGLTVVRMMHYNKRFPLPESKYTLLFGFVGRNQILLAYLVFTMVYTIFTISFLLSL